jgi:hypothetical protein
MRYPALQLAAVALVGCTGQNRPITEPRMAPHHYSPSVVPAPGKERPAEKWLLQVAAEFPGFGSWYLDNSHNLVVYLTDRSQEPAIRNRIMNLFAVDSAGTRKPKFLHVVARQGRFDYTFPVSGVRCLAAWPPSASRQMP